VLANILGIGADYGSRAYGATELARNTPHPNAVNQADYDALLDAADTIAAKSAHGVPTGLNVNHHVPQGNQLDRLIEAFTNTNQYASSGKSRDPKFPNDYEININPNADKAFLAHEMGHVLSDRTHAGRLVATARRNPMLTQALQTALLVSPGAVAALTQGDDDMAASVALAYAASAPKIIDEIMATNQALGIMDTAGMRASLGQRGKLAAGLMTYLGAPMLAATAGNVVGNLMDDELVGQPMPN